MQLEVDLHIERLFLNGIFYRKQISNYKRLLDHIRLNNEDTYYKKIHDVILFGYYTFTQDIFDFIGAASDFAMLNTSNETFPTNYDRFLSYFYYFGFAMVEFRIGYLKYFHSLRKKTKYKGEKSIQYVLNQHFGCKLLKNKYEISANAKTHLEKIFTTTRDEISVVYSNFNNPQNHNVYKFRSEISAVYHYRKHGVMKQIENNEAEIDIKTYIQGAHRIIHDPNSVTSNPSIFILGREKVSLSNNNQYISTYIR
jgi:hypothetical protein